MAGEVMAGEVMAGEVMAGEVMAGTEIPGGWGRVELYLCHAVINRMITALRIR